MTAGRAEHSALLRDILNQPHALAAVADYYLGQGAERIDAAAAVLRSGRLIVLSGIGASLSACYPLAITLASSGLPVVVAEASEVLHYYHTSYHDAVVVLVSRSGESVEIVHAAQELKRQSTRVIAVTCESNSSLARLADTVLGVNTPPDDFVAIQSFVGTLLTHYFLGAAVLGQSRADVRAAVHHTINTLDALVERCESGGQEWYAFLRDAAVVYLLGRGGSLASAHHGALMLNEVAKLPSVGMNAGYFRHGPVEVVDSNFRGFIFAGSPPAHGLNLALARSLQGDAPGICVIGPDLAGKALRSWELPTVDPFLLPLLEIVPIQFASYHLARWRQIRLGEFRFVSQVTRSELEFAH
jgi:glucosamine--fructose-6-phosphate aminotransferase (isomerizing)